MTEEKSTVGDGAVNVSDVNENVRAETVEAQADPKWQKLLRQRKNDQAKMSEIQEKLAHYEAQERQRKEQEAEARGEYDKVVTSYKERLQSIEQENSTLKRNMTDGQKLNAFVSKLPGTLNKQEYLGFVDLETIGLDDETGMVDEQSVELAVNKFVKDYPELFTPAQQKRLPQVGSIGAVGNYSKSIKNMSKEELYGQLVSKTK